MTPDCQIILYLVLVLSNPIMKIKYTLAALVIITVFGINGCSKKNDPPPARDYMQEMKYFIQDLSNWSKSQDPGFLVLTQNGHDMITTDGHPASMPDLDYLASLNGFGRDKLYFGYYNEDQESPFDIQSDWAFMLSKARLNNFPIFVTDYCSTPSKIDTAFARNTRNGFISFATGSYDLNTIPSYPAEPWNESNSFIMKIDSVKNFLFLNNTGTYNSKAEFISAIEATNYDMLITDLFVHGNPLTPGDVELLKQKENGGLRLVLACVSIGEADSSRYYWNSNWTRSPPSWLKAENTSSPGNYYVAYWETEWQDIVYGNADSYVQKIMNAGFDGICLLNPEVYQYFEKNGE